MKKTQKMNHKSIAGFTLIELLVVIAIIGILAAVVLVSLDSARKKGRDARRIRDIQEIHNAIELYISANGKAPDLGTASCTNPAYAGNITQECVAAETPYNISTWNTLESQLSPYIKKLSKDPCGVKCFNYGSPNLNQNGFFTYKYEAPAALGSIPLNITSTSYAIEAENFESKNNTSFGFGTRSSF